MTIHEVNQFPNSQSTRSPRYGESRHPPRDRVAVRYEECDVLLANVHQVHGNTPLLNPDCSVPKVGREPERLVCVFYYQEKMGQCRGTIDEQHELINRRESRGSKKKTKAAKA